MYRGPLVVPKPAVGRNTSFPPTLDGTVIKQWTVKSEANYPGSWYTHTQGLKPTTKEAISHSQAKEIELLLGPNLYDLYASSLSLQVAANGRGAAVTSPCVLPALPLPALAPGLSLEKTATFSRSTTATSTGPTGETTTREAKAHSVTWSPYGPIPSHAYVESERVDSLDEWFDRFGKPAVSHGQHASTKWTPSKRLIGGARSQVIAMKPGSLTR
ncbi:hypothetical protein T492DRAFT_875311 [Pavlovales sp. CCMP2436]|nr:hypothetical protein T492DRAFT_875311 [Pavlovales sp. CCMP2436]